MTDQPTIFTFTERATTVFNPDGSLKGSEARELTGYIETVDVPDAPDGKTEAFRIISETVRPVQKSDFGKVLDSGTTRVADLADKTERLKGAAAECKTLAADLDARTAERDAALATVEEQATLLTAAQEQAREDAVQLDRLRIAGEEATRVADALRAQLVDASITPADAEAA